MDLSLLSSPYGIRESRLLGFAIATPSTARADQISDALGNNPNAFRATPPVRTTAEVEEHARQSSVHTAHEIVNAEPSWGRRVRRGLGWAAAAVVGQGDKVYSAQEAEVNGIINDRTRERVAIAQQQMERSAAGASGEVRRRARWTTNSFNYLRVKLNVCNDEIRILENARVQAEAMANAANGARLHTRRAEVLTESRDIVTRIQADVQARINLSLEGEVMNEVEQTDAYLQQQILAYAPARAANIREHMMEYAMGRRTNLESAIREAAAAQAQIMYPDDDASRRDIQRRIEDRMMRSAQRALTGNQGFWRTVGKRLLDTVTPGGAAGVGTWGLLALTTGPAGWAVAGGVGAGVLAGAAGNGIRALYNRYWKYGTKTAWAWEQAQIATYFEQQQIDEQRGLANVLAANTVPNRLTALRDARNMRPGNRFRITLDGNDLDLGFLNVHSNLVIAVDGVGNRYAFDTDGENGTHYFSYDADAARRRANPDPNAAANAAYASLFSAAANTPTQQTGQAPVITHCSIELGTGGALFSIDSTAAPVVNPPPAVNP